MSERNVFIEPEDRAVIRTEHVYQTESEIGTVGYSDTLLSVVAHFKNSGIPKGCNAQCMVGKSKRGEVALQLFATIDPTSETFVKVGFKSRGCLAMTACASVICAMLESLCFEEALRITVEDLKRELDGVPWDKIHAAYFAVEAVRALIGDYLAQVQADLEMLDRRVPCDTHSVGCIMAEHCSLRDVRIGLLL